jgi:hypothetical protein
MRHIDKTRFREAVADFRDDNGSTWDQIKQTKLNAMNGLSVDQRKAYIRTNPVWNKLQPIMMSLSHNKCWYSEATFGNGDPEVDHFRPKNSAKQKIDYTDPKSKSTIHKPNGYWWLAYDWFNYRLSGDLANKRRRDRLGDSDDVKGKGDYFPLDLLNGRVANDEENCNCEFPVLLDPLEPDDVCLITFDKGIPIPATTDPDEIDRVNQSIFYYHLELDQLNKDRKIVWDECVDQILDAKEAIDNSQNAADRRSSIKKCYKELRKLVDSEKRAFTSTAKACLMVYAELDGYKEWLKDLVRTL